MMIKHLDISISMLTRKPGQTLTMMKCAEQFNITGYVLFRENASIKIEVEGTHENLNHFLQTCHSLPGLDNSELIPSESSIIKGFRQFSIVDCK